MLSFSGSQRLMMLCRIFLYVFQYYHLASNHETDTNSVALVKAANISANDAVMARSSSSNVASLTLFSHNNLMKRGFS